MSDNSQTDHQNTTDNQLQKDNCGEAFQSTSGKVFVERLDAKRNGGKKHDPA